VRQGDINLPIKKSMRPITEELIPEIKNCIVIGVNPVKTILFGSCAYGTPTKDSVPKESIVYTLQEVKKWKKMCLRSLLVP